ncbi:MAG: MraY family glycosyltransferase [Candidatus Sumerlaeota bacterium]|nr:MraY family glycosyltransferase [Candidatus Sumerlaeota bacterium]
MNPVQLALIFAAALSASLMLTWITRGIMRRLCVFDIPAGGRKAHGRPVAYEGGLAMHFAFLAALIAAAFAVPEFFYDNLQMRGLAIGATLIVAVGVADDLVDLRPLVKLAAQLTVGIVMYYHDFRIEKITNPFGEEIAFWAGVSLAGTMLWYALLMNGINMIDGLDGLAAGIAGISGLTLCAIALDMNQPFGAALALIIAGICCGFLPFNFSPATIFMGDAGSMLLGFLLASLTLLSSTKAPALFALLVPLLALGLPLFETIFAFVRRAAQGQHPFRGDRRHLHHRFISLGFSEKRTVLIFYYITAYFGVIAWVLQRLEARATLALAIIVGVGMIFVVENMRYLEKRRSSGSNSKDNG